VWRQVVSLGVGLLVLAGCASGGTEPAREKVIIFVAASTANAVEQIARDFQAETGIRVEVSPGPSSGLAQQIEQGAPADLFLSADRPMADFLAQHNRVAQQRLLLRTRLVVVVPADSPLTVTALGDLADPRVKRLALAAESVPAGEYARAALRRAGVWDAVKDRVVSGTDVRVTLRLVEQGAEAGLVYATDAAGRAQVRIALEVDPRLHPPIEYPLVLVNRPVIKDAARRFYEHLSSDRAAAVFRAAGFDVAP
jgi:molybdate transport system substrate-binding protein